MLLASFAIEDKNGNKLPPELRLSKVPEGTIVLRLVNEEMCAKFFLILIFTSTSKEALAPRRLVAVAFMQSELDFIGTVRSLDKIYKPVLMSACAQSAVAKIVLSFLEALQPHFSLYDVLRQRYMTEKSDLVGDILLLLV